MNWNEKTILLTGGNGFLGKSVFRHLEKKNVKKIIIPSSKEVDLRKKDDCKNILHGVDVVIHLAGRGGGIEYMKKNFEAIVIKMDIAETNLEKII